METHGGRILVAQLEDVASFDSLMNFERTSAYRAGVAGGGLANIRIRGLEIHARGDIAQVIVVPVGAGDHVAAAFKSAVGNDSEVDPNRPERARLGSEGVDDFADGGGTHLVSSHTGREFRLT